MQIAQRERKRERDFKGIYTSDIKASTDRPPNAVLSAASLYGDSSQGLHIQKNPQVDKKIFL